MGNLVANNNCAFQITAGAPLWTPGSPNYVKLQALKEKLSGASTLKGTITWTLPPGGCTWNGPTPPGPGTLVSGAGSMNATSLKKKCDGQFVMRQDDQGVCNGQFIVQVPPTPTPTPVPCTCTFKISNAGQIKVKAD